MAGGKGGRPRKPDYLKIVNGSAKHDPQRINKDAPAFAEKHPEPPDYLTARAADWFRSTVGVLAGMGIASADHTDMLALAAMRYDEILECQGVLEDLGATYITVSVTGSNVYKNRPEVERRNAAMRHFHVLLQEFGLSPAANGKVSVDRAKTENPFADFG